MATTDMMDALGSVLLFDKLRAVNVTHMLLLPRSQYF